MVIKKKIEEELDFSEGIDMKVTLPVNKIEENVERNNYSLAVLFAANQIEMILINRLKRCMGESIADVIGLEKRGLGCYRDWCSKLNLVEDDKLEKIKDLIDLRNNIAHDYYFLMNSDAIKEGVKEELKDKIESALEKSKEFIRNTPLIQEKGK